MKHDQVIDNPFGLDGHETVWKDLYRHLVFNHHPAPTTQSEGVKSPPDSGYKVLEELSSYAAEESSNIEDRSISENSVLTIVANVQDSIGGVTSLQSVAERAPIGESDTLEQRQSQGAIPPSDLEHRPAFLKQIIQASSGSKHSTNDSPAEKVSDGVAPLQASKSIPTRDAEADATTQRAKAQIGMEETEASKNHDPTIPADIIVGGNSHEKRYSIIGRTTYKPSTVALDSSDTSVISLFGVQGSGKSYTLGVLAEAYLLGTNGTSSLDYPLAGVFFHYSQTSDYAPEAVSMSGANSNPADIEKLRNLYGASPQPLNDIVIVVPEAKVEERRREYPGLTVVPLKFASRELSVNDWMILMKAASSDSTYLSTIRQMMKDMRNRTTLDALSKEVEITDTLSTQQKKLARGRLRFAGDYIDETATFSSVFKPGRLVIVDLRDEYIDTDEALSLFVVVMDILAAKGEYDGRRYNRFVVFDEAHKYMNDKALTQSIVTAIREVRHKGMTVMIASQDPPSLPNEIIELSTVVFVHRFNSPAWLKHIQRSILAFERLDSTDIVDLRQGQGYVWSSKSTDANVESRPLKIEVRPRITQHGGHTKRVGDS